MNVFDRPYGPLKAKAPSSAPCDFPPPTIKYICGLVLHAGLLPRLCSGRHGCIGGLGSLGVGCGMLVFFA